LRGNFHPVHLTSISPRRRGLAARIAETPVRVDRPVFSVL
jgi:hypothetical protein